MENASKALIIAGAILISILLISVGIIVMNAINDPISQAGSSAESQAIEIFNSKFTAYMGKNLDYSTVKSLFTTVTAVNATSEVKADTNRKITFDTGTDCISSISSLSAGDKYDVTIEDTKPSDGLDGYYDKITVKKQD